MRLVLADTGYWIALREKADTNHTKARQLAFWLAQLRCQLVVTPFIFAEVHASFSRMRNIREQIIGDIWENPIVRMEQPSLQDQEQALRLLRDRRDKSYSFCDALSFVVMLRMNIAQAASFDQHFRQFGRFEVLDGSSL